MPKYARITAPVLCNKEDKDEQPTVCVIEEADLPDMESGICMDREEEVEERISGPAEADEVDALVEKLKHLPKDNIMLLLRKYGPEKALEIGRTAGLPQLVPKYVTDLGFSQHLLTKKKGVSPHYNTNTLQRQFAPIVSSADFRNMTSFNRTRLLKPFFDPSLGHLPPQELSRLQEKAKEHDIALNFPVRDAAFNKEPGRKEIQNIRRKANMKAGPSVATKPGGKIKKEPEEERDVPSTSGVRPATARIKKEPMDDGYGESSSENRRLTGSPPNRPQLFQPVRSAPKRAITKKSSAEEKKGIKKPRQMKKQIKQEEPSDYEDN